MCIFYRLQSLILRSYFRQNIRPDLEAVAAARLLEDGDLVQVGGHGGVSPPGGPASRPTWDSEAVTISMTAGIVKLSQSLFMTAGIVKMSYHCLTDAGVPVPGSVLGVAHVPEHDLTLGVHLSCNTLFMYVNVIMRSWNNSHPLTSSL